MLPSRPGPRAMPVQYGQSLEITRESCDGVSRRERSSVDRGNGLRTRGSRSDRCCPGIGTGADPERTSGETTRRAGGRQCDASDKSRVKSLRDRITARGVAEATSVRRPLACVFQEETPWTNQLQSIDVNFSARSVPQSAGPASPVPASLPDRNL